MNGWGGFCVGWMWWVVGCVCVLEGYVLCVWMLLYLGDWIVDWCVGGGGFGCFVWVWVGLCFDLLFCFGWVGLGFLVFMFWCGF